MSRLARIAQAVDRLTYRAARAPLGAPVIEPYLGYATPDGMIVRGRVLRALRRSEPRAGHGPIRRLRQMAALFLTHEIAGAEIRASAFGVATRSDPEGYFQLEIPMRPATGWAEVEVAPEGGAAVDCPVRVPAPGAEYGIVSDIDDTVIRTGAWSLARNLWTTFTGSLDTREVFDDAVALLERLSGGGVNPVFYVSSSPWNLHHFLLSLFDRAGVPRGPLFLRDYGLSVTRQGAAAHLGHKGAAIGTVLDANPGLPFVLIGDTGQHDAHIYRRVAEAAPGRIRAVILRRAGREAEAAEVAALRALGVPVEVVAHYGSLSAAAIVRRAGG
ncbi:phosphatase domain-containing protein [Wenxinia saemankumensis]|uniref:Phosphatidate phosphatase APP1 n=1 Tax=Wenxinia saemankumensis TaxID=1447782 RepID=A0A1M6FR10_9RHOB|nr:phosphatase domain-containing protein [Wenxinia saemankumensis]SHJ00093.1 Phosphatidate phosphatase APP1 [Wenxinia saemankumensis]